MLDQQSERLEYLDAVRGFALILGIVFHASLSFMPMFIGWAVMDISTSNSVAVFALVSHSFRMELFFLLAGFFSHMAFHRRGSRAFVLSRLMRIALPFVVGWFILRPLLVSGWLMGAQSMQGDVYIVQALKQGYSSLMDLPNGLLVGTHLWFLYYLLLITAIALAFRYVMSVNPSLKYKITAFSDAALAWICRSRLSSLIVVPTTAVCLWFMHRWGVDTPDQSLVPHFPVLVVYGSFFVFGWLLHRQPTLLNDFAELTWTKCVMCMSSIVVAALLAHYEMQPGHPNHLVFKTIFTVCYAAMMWLLVALSIGVCQALLAKRNKLVRYIADTSYWMYLIHLPIVVWIQIAVAELSLHWSLKWLFVVLLTLVICLSTYQVISFIQSRLKMVFKARKPIWAKRTAPVTSKRAKRAV